MNARRAEDSILAQGIRAHRGPSRNHQHGNVKLIQTTSVFHERLEWHSLSKAFTDQGLAVFARKTGVGRDFSTDNASLLIEKK